MADRRAIVGEILPTAGSERRACRWLGFHRTAVRYVPDLRDDTALRTRLREIAEAQPGLGARFTLGSADTGFPRRLPSDSIKASKLAPLSERSSCSLLGRAVTDRSPMRP